MSDRERDYDGSGSEYEDDDGRRESHGESSGSDERESSDDEHNGDEDQHQEEPDNESGASHKPGSMTRDCLNESSSKKKEDEHKKDPEGLFGGNKDLRASLRSATKGDDVLKKAMVPNKSSFSRSRKSGNSDDRRRGRSRTRSRSPHRRQGNSYKPRGKKPFNSKGKFEKKPGKSSGSGSSSKKPDKKD